MRKIKFLSVFSVIGATAGLCLLSGFAHASHVHWSVNVGVPVVTAPAVVYAGPTVPVVSVVRTAPVVVYPHATHVVVTKGPVHWRHPAKRHVRDRHHR